MPAKKRGKGFTTKKRKRKSQSPSPSSRPPPSGSKSSAAKKPVRTPSAASIKRKEREALALSAPRRVSLRLQELKTRKMSLENGGSLGAASTAVEIVTQLVNQEVEDDGGMVKHVQHAGSNSHGRKRASTSQVSNEEEAAEREHSTDHDEDEEESDDDPEEVGTVMEAPRIDALPQLKEVDEDFANHAVYIYFWNTGIMTPTVDDVKRWIYAELNGGKVRHCRDLGRGFFFVYFEQSATRTKALLYSKPDVTGVQVTVFPWCNDTVNEKGEQLTPRVLYLPELPLQYLSLLPVIGRSLGTYIGSIGALDPDADMESVRAGKNGWESAYNLTPVEEVGNTRIAVMMSPHVKPPPYVQLQVREGVYKKQVICEQRPGQVGSKRKGGGGGIKDVAGGVFSRRTPRKKLKT